MRRERARSGSGHPVRNKRSATTYATIFSLWAVVWVVLTGGRVLEKYGPGLTLPQVLLVCYLGAVVAGVVVGVLKPMSKTLIGSALLGLIVAVPLAFMAAMSIIPRAEWDQGFDRRRTATRGSVSMSFLIAALVTSGACRMPAHRPARAPAETDSSAGSLDSVRAVKAAIDSFYAVFPKSERASVRVTSFTRDSTGFLVRISWVTPTGVVETGGGALVRVGHTGAIKSMVLYQ
jgi:hypothetical protein